MSKQRFPLELRLFGTLREVAGTDSVQVELGTGATIHDVRESLAGIPALAGLAASAAFAVNRRYAEESDEVSAGDEVAVIPPVAGG